MRDVPVTIGSEELKRLTFRHVLAAYNAHMADAQSKNTYLRYVSLDMEDVRLCDKFGVPYDMAQTKDVIASHFFKDFSTKGHRGQFKERAQPLVLYLAVGNSVYMIHEEG